MKKKLADAGEVEGWMYPRYTPPWLVAQARKVCKFYSKLGSSQAEGLTVIGSVRREARGPCLAGHFCDPYIVKEHSLVALSLIAGRCKGGIRSIKAVLITGTGPLHYFLVSRQNDRVKLL